MYGEITPIPSHPKENAVCGDQFWGKTLNPGSTFVNENPRQSRLLGLVRKTKQPNSAVFGFILP
jgi:hypothetical protein